MRNKGFWFTMTSLMLLFAFGCIMLSQLFVAQKKQGTTTGGFFDVYIPKPVNVLLLVKDRFSGNTDTVMLVNYKPLTGKINMLSIPRDTKVVIDGEAVKINSAYWRGGKGKQGAQYAKDAVKQLLDVKIDHYAILELDVVPKLVNALGGVDYNVPIDMIYQDKSQDLYINLKKGQQHLNGNQVEQLLRYRHPNNQNYPEGFFNYFDGGDLTRIDNQQKFFMEFFKQKANLSVVPKINDILEIVLKNTETDLSFNECIKLLTKVTKLTEGNLNAKLNTFRILGTDELPNWFYVFNNKIKNNKTKTEMDAELVIQRYFGHNEVPVNTPLPSVSP